MFSPQPSKDDGWFGWKENFVTELLSMRTDYNRERSPLAQMISYPNQRWRKYLMNLWLKKYKDYRLHYGRYLCRRWNSRKTNESVS